MPHNQLSSRDVVRLTSGIVAAFCAANRLSPQELPAVITAVGQKLEGLDSMPLIERAEALAVATISEAALPDGALTNANRRLPHAHVSSRRSVPSAALGKRWLTTLKLRPISPKAVAAVSSAYQDAMSEVAGGNAYLPSRTNRGMMAEKMIAAADLGERDPTRLKEAGVAALRDNNVVPLSLAFAARLRGVELGS